MKLEISPDVVRDLWPLCQSGDASTDSRALVDAYLATDVDLLKNLEEITNMSTAMPEVALSPDAERQWVEWRPTWRTVGQSHNIRFKPLYEVVDESYTVYFPIVAA